MHAGSALAEKGSDDMNPDPQSPNESLVLDFFALWKHQKLDAILEYFSDDSIYMDMPLPPRRGLAAIRSCISSIFDTFSIAIETTAIASRGDMVFTERIDYLVGRDGASVDVPVAGVMVIRNGTILEWRDYVDVGTVAKGLSLSIEATNDPTDTVSMRSIQSR
jgi:limonene-1,2-epoxide hydrolase